MLNNWLKIAFINYKKNWLSTIINLFGLTVGLTGFMLILMHWNDEESFESWNPKKNEIYSAAFFYKKNKDYGSNISYPMAETGLKKIPEIQDYLLLAGTGSDKFVTSQKSFYAENGFAVSKSFFKFFPFKCLAGSYQNIFETKTDIALSSELAQNLFGTQNPIGQKVKMSIGEFLVKAVYEIPKENSQLKPNYVLLGAQHFDADKDQWGNFNYGCFFMLKKGADPAVVERKFKTEVIDLRAKLGTEGSAKTSPEEYLDLYGPNELLLTPITEIKLHAKSSWFGNPDFKIILILFSLSVLIVVLSAINFINLKTAQSSQRAKEIGVRKAIGVSKSSLVLQFLLETFIICLFSYLLSLALTELLLPSFNEFFGKEIVMNDWRIYFYSFLMVLAVTLISGIIPAIYLSNFKAIETLKGNFARSKHGIWLRNGILTLQLIISSFFIIGGLIVNSQVKYMMNKDLGFNGKQILFIVFNEYTPKPWLKYEKLKTEVSKIKGVEEVSFGEASPNSGSNSSSNIDFQNISIDGQHGAMDYNYLQFMGVKLKKGRWLNPNLASDTINTFLVNEAFVKEMGWTDEQALNNQVNPGFDYQNKYKIVGIVKDFNLNGLNHKVNPVVFFHYRETEWKRFNIQNMQVKISADNQEETLNRLKQYWETKVEPGYPFTSYFLDQRFARTFVKYQKQKTLFTILNAMVLMVALLGLFALSSLMIEQKLKEVAIRKTLGASDSNLMLGLTKQFLWMTLIAVLISIPISYYFMNEWLKDFAYRIEMPFFPFVLSLVVLLTLTFTVVSIKAYKATKVNLVNYLKYE